MEDLARRELTLGIFGNAGAGEGAENSGVPYHGRKEKFRSCGRRNAANQVVKHVLGDCLAFRVLEGRPFTRRVENLPKERDIYPTSILGGDVGKKPRIIKAGGQGEAGGGAYVSLDSLDIRLGRALDAFAFGYFLRVRCEDLTRLLRGCIGEGGVVEAEVEAPSGEVAGASERSAIVALSS